MAKVRVILAVLLGFVTVAVAAAPAQAFSGYYTLVNEKSGDCLAYEVPTARLLALPCTGATTQQWTIDAVTGTSYYRMTSRANTGRCVNQDYSGGTPHNDMLVWPCSGAANERWTVLNLGGFVHLAFKSAASGRCIDQDYSGGLNHVDVLAWTCQGAFPAPSNQVWTTTSA